MPGIKTQRLIWWLLDDRMSSSIARMFIFMTVIAVVSIAFIELYRAIFAGR